MDTSVHGPPAAATVPDAWTQVLSEFEHFARDYRQNSPDTVQKHRTYLNRFHAHFQSPSPRELFSALSLRTLEQFVLDYAKDHGPGSRRAMHLALCTFLRFAHHQGYLSTDLTPAVPTVRQRRLAELPKAMPGHAVENLVETLDLTTPSGMRTHAIVQLLHTYGVRGVHIRSLTLSDIDWRNQCIHFHPAKRGKRITQALTAPVGNSLLRYLRDARPPDTPYGLGGGLGRAGGQRSSSRSTSLIAPCSRPPHSRPSSRARYAEPTSTCPRACPTVPAASATRPRLGRRPPPSIRPRHAGTEPASQVHCGHARPPESGPPRLAAPAEWTAP